MNFPAVSPARRFARKGFGFALAALTVFTWAPIPTLARQGEVPPSQRLSVAPGITVDLLRLQAIDRGALLAEDEVTEATKPGPRRFAQPITVAVTPQNAGTWEFLEDGARLWRLRVEVPGATDLNFGFARYNLPEGATLHCASEIQEYFEGPYSAVDNAVHGELWLPVVPGDMARIELYVPAVVKFEPELELSQVGAGYRDFFHLEREMELRQGACNNDVVCPEGDPWRDEIASVAVYQLNGAWTCSGTMVNNVTADFKPYFLTAFHCGITAGNAATMVVYWNFESPNCGDLCCGSLADNQTGAFFRARRQDVDFCLVELDEDPDPGSNVYFAGWENSGVVPSGSVTIHHPNTDEKAISFNDDALTTTSSCIGGGGSNTHWNVDNYEDGTTEPGSSGSSLWNPATHHVIGFLSGGPASCSNISFDCYGKFAVAWNGTTADARLRDWLDPANTGATSLEGSFPSGVGSLKFVSNTATDACVSNPANVNGIWEPGETITLPVTIRAAGGSHSNISGTLSSPTPGITIVDGSATWPNLASGATSISDAPHFTIRLGEAMACNTAIVLNLSLASAEGGPFPVSFGGTVGQAIVPGGLPLSIPDNNPTGATSNLIVGTSAVLSDVNCRVKIDHTWVGDLKIQLQSPAGTTVTLFDRPGVPASANGCSDDNLNVTFDDASAVNLESLCPGSDPWYVGSGAPVTPLSAFNGQNSLGTWKLIVSDLAGQDEGAVTEWELLTSPPLVGICNVCNEGAVAVENFGSDGPNRLVLSPGAPNPFDRATSFEFAVPASGLTTLEIFDVSGRLVRTLVSGDFAAGTHRATWNGRDDRGGRAAVGIYFARLSSGEGKVMQRVHLVR